MSKLLLVRLGAVSLQEATATPLFVAPRYPEGYDAVVVIGSISGGGTSVGSLQAVWSGDSSIVRRPSGGGEYRASGGDYFFSIVFPQGTLRGVLNIAVEELDSVKGLVYGVGKSASRPYIEAYSTINPEGLLNQLFPDWSIEEGDPLDASLLESIIGKLTDYKWIDPIRGEGEIVTHRVGRDKHYFGLVGIVRDGLIVSVWPDSNIHVYPPGLARSIIREAGMSPPSPSLAFTLANSFVGLVEYAGLDAEDIFDACMGFMDKAESVAGGRDS